VNKDTVKSMAPTKLSVFQKKLGQHKTRAKQRGTTLLEQVLTLTLTMALTITLGVWLLNLGTTIKPDNQKFGTYPRNVSVLKTRFQDDINHLQSCDKHQSVNPLIMLSPTKVVLTVTDETQPGNVKQIGWEYIQEPGNSYTKLARTETASIENCEELLQTPPPQVTLEEHLMVNTGLVDAYFTGWAENQLYDFTDSEGVSCVEDNTNPQCALDRLVLNIINPPKIGDDHTRIETHIPR